MLHGWCHARRVLRRVPEILLHLVVETCTPQRCRERSRLASWLSSSTIWKEACWGGIRTRRNSKGLRIARSLSMDVGLSPLSHLVAKLCFLRLEELIREVQLIVNDIAPTQVR